MDPGAPGSRARTYRQTAISCGAGSWAGPGAAAAVAASPSSTPLSTVMPGPSVAVATPRKSQSRPTVQRFLDLALVAHDLNIRAQEKLKEGIRGVLAEVPGGAALK